jgi:flagellar export protein FliJ
MQSQRKIKRVQPLIKMKKSKVDEEAAVLIAIRNEKIEVVKQMKDNQKRYMEGVEQLNRIRVSKVRENLEMLESSLDYVKQQWYKLYKQVQTIEGKERQQIMHLLTAERELKSVEKLEEKYKVEMQKELGRMDQKLMDDAALRRFAQK